MYSSASDKFHCFRAIMKARGLLCLAAHATGQAELEVNIRPGAPGIKNPFEEEYLSSLVLCQSPQLFASVCNCVVRTKETLRYSGAFPTNVQEVVDISAGPKIRGHISGQIFSGLEMTTASVTAMPTMFPGVSLWRYPHKTILVHFSVP